MGNGRGFCLAGSVIACAQAWAAGESILVDGFDGGLSCTTVAPTTLIVDARSALVQPTFLLNGAPFSASALQSGDFYLIPEEGEPVLLGTSFAPPPGGVRVLKGVYDVQYRWRAGDQVPRNVAARVLQGVLIDGNGALVVDVPSTTLRGALTMNAAPFPQTEVSAATLSLEGIHALGRVVLGSSNDSIYNVRLIPGAYDLRYQSPGSSGAIPRNQDALRERYDIGQDTDVLNVDIPAVLTSFEFQIGGVQAPDNGAENGVLSLRTKTGDRVDLGESRVQSLNRRLIPGSYDAYWEGLSGGDTAPANKDSRFERDLAIGAGIVVLDVPVVSAAGDFTVNGAVPPIALEVGRVWVRDQLTGSELLIGTTDFGEYARLLIPDTYDLVYTELSSASDLPANKRVIFERDRSFKNGAQDIDIPVAPLSWQLTLNGSPFPDSNAENGRIWIRSVRDLEDTSLGETRFLGANPGQRLLVPGNYAPIYDRIAGADAVPANQYAMLAHDYVVAPGEPGTQTIEVNVGSFAFSFRNNGVVFANDPARVASFELRHREDVVNIGTTSQGVGTQLLIANVRPLPDGRTATAYYTWQAGGLTEMPQNVDQPVACFAFVTP